jgi:MYXO-CTERM domain-containing protein
MLTSTGRWVVLITACLALAPSPASACGGLFCDRPPQMPDAFGNPPPVQSGEEIVYGLESDGSLVMSVRIFYQGAAPEFSWILPVPATPAISLGTDTLFDAMTVGTTPAFVITDSHLTGTCAADPTCELGFRDAGAVAFSDASARDAGGGPTVELMSTLGPYETVVLSGGTGAEVQAWLTSHGYVVPSSAASLLDEYASHGSHFVALRLRGDASVDQIQPITLTMPTTSPCLPIRLTALATQPDLGITAFFLADGRAVSSNYSMLDPDWADRGLYDGTTSYFSYITRAADAAGGHAFATDYAGTTPTVSLELPSVLDLGSATDPAMLLQQLNARGYLRDPQILAVLADYLVPPDGMMPRAYYNCLLFAGACGAPSSFDPMGAVTAIDQTITAPRHDAQALTARHPYTTRLFTTLSADEMTLDPEFRLDSALPTVAATRGAVLTETCDSAHYRDEVGGFYTSERGLVFGTYPPQVHSGADAWCTRHGGVWHGAPGLDGGRYPDGGAAEPRVATGGAGCSVGASGSPTIWALVVLGLVLAHARRRRSRQA